jgi:hypothetical protein
MIKVAIICNDVKHVRTVLGIDPRNRYTLVITPENTSQMYGFKDIYYYELRPMYAREADYAGQHNWKSINKVELFELLGVEQ